MKPNITLSLNPSYFCSERCDFCYLLPSQLADRTTLSIDKLSTMLEEVSQYYTIEHIDLYGGEPTLLPRDYIMDLMTVLSQYVSYVNVNTNLVTLPLWLQEIAFFYPCVSFDGTAREKEDIVLANMEKLGQHRAYSVITLASEKVVQNSPNVILEKLMIAGGAVSWEIKPYSSNQSNQQGVSYIQYVDYVYDALRACKVVDIHLVNQDYLNDVLSHKRNAFSDDHLYITPQGKFAVLEFDLNDHEYFLELSNIKEYKEWCIKERDRISNNRFCNQCEYFGRCLTEHYREVKHIGNSCNGFYHLIKRYEDWGT